MVLVAAVACHCCMTHPLFALVRGRSCKRGPPPVWVLSGLFEGCTCHVCAAVLMVRCVTLHTIVCFQGPRVCVDGCLLPHDNTRTVCLDEALCNYLSLSMYMTVSTWLAISTVGCPKVAVSRGRTMQVCCHATAEGYNTQRSSTSNPLGRLMAAGTC